MKTAKSSHENILSHVLGIFPMPEHPETQTEHRPLEPFHQTAHTGLFTAQAASDECRIIVGHKHFALQNSFKSGNAPPWSGVLPVLPRKSRESFIKGVAPARIF